jgi:hypothetical protein
MVTGGKAYKIKEYKKRKDEASQAVIFSYVQLFFLALVILLRHGLQYLPFEHQFEYDRRPRKLRFF